MKLTTKGIKNWLSELTLIEWMIGIVIVAILFSLVVEGTGDNGWLNKPVGELTLKDLLILKLLLD